MQQSFAASSTSTNKAANAGFEIGPAGGATPPNWSTYGEAGQESWAAETGTNGVAFRGWVTNGFGGLIQDIPVNSAQGGVFSFSIRGNAEANFQSSSQEAWIKMEFWKQGEGSFRSQVSNSVYSALTGSPGTWQTFTIGATNSDSQVDLVKILVGFGNAVAPGGAMACRWDNASLIQSTPGGMTYVVEGYINNPTLDRMTGTAYGAYLLEFYNGTDLVSVVDTLHFTSTNAADSWQKFSVTNWSPYSGTVSGKLSATILGSSTNFSGALYFDTTCVTPTNVPHSNVSSGAIFNPGFEYTANGTKLKYVDSWTNFGFDGAVQSTFKRSGEHALQIFFTETLAGQYWNATGGYRYANSAYAFTPSTDRFAGHSNLQAVLVMEFLNATGGVLISYASSPFKTNAPANVWSNLTVSGMAPNGTVRARTLVGIVGSTTGYAGSVYFDDVSQSILSTGGTTSCGILQNPGFDDGLPGNIDALQLNGDLPAWVWLGGTNGGFVQTDYKYDGFQALGITFPHQLAVQSFTAQTGMSYVLSGRIMNPAAQRLQDSAYGVFLLQFISGSNVISTKESAHFTTNNAADVWTYFAVTSRAPISGTFTGRVAAFLQGDHNGDTGFAGVVYYDGLCLTATNIPFTVTTNGALENPGFEDSACGTAFEFVDNWTALGNAGVVDCTVARSGANSLQIYFPANLMQQDWPAGAGHSAVHQRDRRRARQLRFESVCRDECGRRLGQPVRGGRRPAGHGHGPHAHRPRWHDERRIQRRGLF